MAKHIQETATDASGYDFVLDEDNMTSDSATKIPTQQSVKAYVDDLMHSGETPGTAGLHDKNLANWYAAMETAKTTPVDIVIVGDSISGSIFNLKYDGTDNRDSWAAKVANMLNRRIGITTATSGFLYAKGDVNAPSMTETTGSNPAALATWGIGGWAVELDNGEYIRQESNMDGISIMYTKHSTGGTMRIRDGGAAGTILADIDTYNATTESGHVWTSDALTYASHNIYIENIDAGEKVVVEACYVHSGTRDKGFRIWQAAHGGWWTSIFTAYPTTYLHQIERLQPSLVISACGTNDDTANIDTRNRTLLDSIQGVAPNTDIVMWIPYIGSTYTTADREILIDIANDYGLTYIDATVVIGAINQPGNPFAVDTVHPNETGRTMIANQVYQIIGGDPLGTAVYEAVKAQAPTLTQAWKGSNGELKVSEFFQNLALVHTPTSGDGFALYPSYLWSLVNGMPGSALMLGSLYLAKASATELSMGTSTNLILADPTGATHAATKGYVDSAIIPAYKWISPAQFAVQSGFTTVLNNFGNSQMVAINITAGNHRRAGLPLAPIGWNTMDVEVYWGTSTTDTGTIILAIDYDDVAVGSGSTNTSASTTLNATGVALTLNKSTIATDLPAYSELATYNIRYSASSTYPGVVQILGLKYIRKT